MDLTGIINENEFFSDHYLHEMLEDDLREVFTRWRAQNEQGVSPPHERLSGLAAKFFKAGSRMRDARSPEDRADIRTTFLVELINALGYEYAPGLIPGEGDAVIPVIGAVPRGDGSFELVILETEAAGEDVDPLELPLQAGENGRNGFRERDGRGRQPHSAGRAGNGSPAPARIPRDPLAKVITEHIFRAARPPRRIIVMGGGQIVLVDRGKWADKRLFRFDLSEIFGRREAHVFRAVAALISKDALSPQEGPPLLDDLDENSRRHAVGVSQDLKTALRRSVELLGNAASKYLREVRHEAMYGKEMAERLSDECLRYLYRLVFIFFVEARKELGLAPREVEAFRKGYSLDVLRDLELVKLTTEESRNGFFFDETIRLLFRLRHEGFAPSSQGELGQEYRTLDFSLPQLRSRLFDPKGTEMLNRVRFPNHVLQEVIRHLSLSRPARGRANRRGRISYAALGVNQLGAVYEGLLCYKGFFAETDLYEVKKADEPYDEFGVAYFVPAEELNKYLPEERVFNDDGSPKAYRKGDFIYRLAGRERTESASYYTPEALTRCLVKYALKELLEGKTADDILELTVCEPAMGSAAFLNEAVNQLAEEYLRRKQAEIGRIDSPEAYARELRKTKMFIADRNVFGVDRNKTATELAEVSLWLNTIYAGAHVPWFRMQLKAGDSLVGARRMVFPSRSLAKGGGTSGSWLEAVPERVPLGTPLPPRAVWHFLVPDKAMALYDQRALAEIAKAENDAIRSWRNEFTKPFEKGEIARLERLSAAIDRLWERHVTMLRRTRQRTQDPIDLYGRPVRGPAGHCPTLEEKDNILDQEILAKAVRSSSPYRRLKLVMDYWAALWFWPIEKAHLLPTRAEFMMDLMVLVEGGLFGGEPGEQVPLLPETMPEAEARAQLDEFGFVNVDELCAKNERLALVNELSEKAYHFHHWELEFADVFADRGGFDLVLGNPPWIKVEWEEGAILGDYEPLFTLRRYSAAQLTKLKLDTIAAKGIRSQYLSAFEKAEAFQNFLNATQNYPLLKGMQSNLYKCFLPQAWMVGRADGVSAFLHPEGVYDDPHGGAFREELYQRLRYHFQFYNEMILFPDVHHNTQFSVNVYRNGPSPGAAAGVGGGGPPRGGAGGGAAGG
jgi:hypothetical protein